MFRKEICDHYPGRKIYYVFYEVLSSDDEFYRFLSEYSSSISGIHIWEDSDCGMKCIEGRYSFEQFLEIANSSKSFYIDSISIAFNDGQSMVYNPYENELFCQTGNPDFDVEEYFAKLPKNTTPVTTHQTDREDAATENTPVITDQAGQKESAVENKTVHSFNRDELIKYTQIFKSRGLLKDCYDSLELYQNGFKISFGVDSWEINGMIRKLVNEDIVSISSFFTEDRGCSSTTTCWDEDSDGLPMLIEKTEEWGGDVHRCDKCRFSWSSYESDYGELKGKSKFFDQNIEIKLIAYWGNPGLPDAIDTPCDPTVTISVPSCDIEALAQYVDTYFKTKITFNTDKSVLFTGLRRLLEEDIESITSFVGADYGYEEALPSAYNCDSGLHYDDWEYTRYVEGRKHIFSDEHFSICDSYSLVGKSRFFKNELDISAFGEKETLVYGEKVVDHYSVHISAFGCSEDALKVYAKKYFEYGREQRN